MFQDASQHQFCSFNESLFTPEYVPCAVLNMYDDIRLHFKFRGFSTGLWQVFSQMCVVTFISHLNTRLLWKFFLFFLYFIL